MNDEEKTDVLIDSADWYAKQASALVKQYRACRTAHARRRLLPKLQHIYSKLVFERRGLDRVISDHQSGEEWKNEA